MALQTRKPTGRAGYPKLLIEGPDKTGKSWSIAELSASRKVGRTIVLPLGEDVSRWDEYGAIEGARFELVDHDGRWPSIMSIVQDAKAEAAKAREAGEPPFVFAFDSMGAEDEGLKDWARWRARNTRNARKLLAEDPNAEIDVSPNFWNDKRARHRSLMGHLITFPGIVIMTARGSEVTLFRDGKPVAGQTTWSIEADKNIGFDASAHIRLFRGAPPQIIASSGIHFQIKPGEDRPHKLTADWSLEHVIFDLFKLDPGGAAIGSITEMTFEQMTPEQIVDEALSKDTSAKRIRELYEIAVNARYHDTTVQNEHLAEEPLLGLLIRFGKDKAAKEQPGAPAGDATPESGAAKPAGGQLRDASRPADAPAGETAAQDSGEPGEQVSEADFVRDFYTRLEGTSGLDGIEERRSEVSKALTGKTIAPGTASELYGDIQKKKRTLGRAA